MVAKRSKRELFFKPIASIQEAEDLGLLQEGTSVLAMSDRSPRSFKEGWDGFRETLVVAAVINTLLLVSTGI